jgi:hexosaminidase
MIDFSFPVFSRRTAAVVGAVLLLAAQTVCAADVEPSLLPRPASVEVGAGRFELASTLTVQVPAGDAVALDIATLLAQRVQRSCGRKLDVSSTSGDFAAIVLSRTETSRPSPPEAYRVEVAETGIALQAATDAGLRQGATTVLQLICMNGDSLPFVTIDDHPQFAWRGVMLDSARHYQSPDYLRHFLDAMALHKLNVLHWHLTDDQAWRLEIKKYPRLTEVGAWRVPAGAAARADIDPATGKPRLYGGFYSQQTVRELVAYAARLGITIVPEIEMPGHASAAITAYPELGAKRASVTEVPSDWGIYPNAFALDEPTFEFLQDVLRETLALFPSPWIHVGGDEVEAGQWLASDAGRALAKKLGTEDGHALQAHFTQRIAKFVADNGRTMIGWDEILSPGLARDAVVMSWRGVDGAVKAAAQGHDTVLSPWPMLYFDNRQSTALDEPPGRVKVISLRDVYHFDPSPAALSPQDRKHILGLQGAVWAEHIRTEARVDHMTFPRAAAIAEVAWTPSERRDWNEFAHRLGALVPLYQSIGLDYADSAFAPEFEVAQEDGKVSIEIETQGQASDIRYTLDGSEPRADSARYYDPLTATPPLEVRARSFIGSNAVSKERRKAIRIAEEQSRSSRELTLCGDAIPIVIEDDAPVRGERALFAVDIQNPCWVFPKADLSDITAIEVQVGQVPFNFQIGAARDKIEFAKPGDGGEELQVRLDACDGEIIARLPLESAVGNNAVTLLEPAKIRAQKAGLHDLCFRFAQHRLDPVWVIDRIRLVR